MRTNKTRINRASFSLAIFYFFVATSTAMGVPTLPVPPGGTYSINFTYPWWRVVPGDLDGDGVLDFVTKSDLTQTTTMRIEARFNNGSKAWEFDTKADTNIAGGGGNTDNVPILVWDFNNDGRAEVYYQYYSASNGGW